jgi:hypothetical protein
MSRILWLRRMPVGKMLAVAEVVVLTRRHVRKLAPAERRRLAALIRRARGRPRNLAAGERAELAALIAKADPRLFLGLVADRLSPVPLPARIVRGKR